MGAGSVAGAAHRPDGSDGTRRAEFRLVGIHRGAICVDDVLRIATRSTATDRGEFVVVRGRIGLIDVARLRPVAGTIIELAVRAVGLGS